MVEIAKERRRGRCREDTHARHRRPLWIRSAGQIGSGPRTRMSQQLRRKQLK